jgi:hypothetical protein
MKKHRFRFMKWAILVVALFFGIVLACQEDFEPFVRNETSTQDDASVLEAKNWYDTNIGNAVHLRSDNQTVVSAIKPAWEYNYTYSDRKYKTVELLLFAENRFKFIESDCAAKYEETQDSKYKQSITRLVIRTNRKTKEKDGFLMTISPDLKYLEKTDFNPFEKNHYLKRDSKFSGYIFYHDMNGNFVNGWRYWNGKPHYIEHRTEKPQDFELRSSGICVNTYLLWEIETCYGTDYGNYQIINEDGCIYSYELEYWFTECLEDWLNGEFSSIETSAGGGGGYTQSTQPQVTLSGQNTVSLLANYGLNVTISGNLTITSVKYLIYKPSQTQYTLANNNSLSCNLQAKKPGYWTIKAIVNNTFESNELSVEVQYPNVNAIKSNATVLSNMNSVWAATKNAASSSGRCEKGFGIFLNTTTSSYTCGATVSGPMVSCGELAYISTTVSGATSYPDPTIGGIYPVAFFHAHTPYTYCPTTDRREVGPTDQDRSNELPGLVYDYMGMIYPGGLYPGASDFFGISGGHNLNLAAMIYTCGPNRRATPN